MSSPSFRIDRQQYRRLHTTQFESSNWWSNLPTLRCHTPKICWSHSCTFCNTKLLNTERNGWCCNQGKYIQNLQPLHPLPTSIIDLCYNPDIHFSWLCRRINSLYAFTAIGTTGSFIHVTGVSNVVVTGRIYHRMLNLNTPNHSFYWFLYDEDSRYTAAQQFQISRWILNNLTDTLRLVNPYIHQLQAAISMVSSDEKSFAIELDLPTTGGELAAIVQASNLTHIEPRKIVVFNKTSTQPRFISILSNQYELLQYPLLFPYGDIGWYPQRNLQSQCIYYRIRILTDYRFRLLGRLTCEYLIDMYSRVEEERLNYIQQGRQRQVQQYKLAHDSEVGFENILPASFLGSRAWAAEQVADALALCRKYGKPSLFLTMTTNPKWPEIVEVLQPHQTAAEVPEVVCRVFKARLEKLLDLVKKHLGTIIYTVRVIEFQKRGLPHCHMLFKVIFILYNDIKLY